eukprot:SAG22_NODE_3321_length_1780_cov_2.068412_3_plen_55_part_01
MAENNHGCAYPVKLCRQGCSIVISRAMPSGARVTPAAAAAAATGGGGGGDGSSTE